VNWHAEKARKRRQPALVFKISQRIQHANPPRPMGLKKHIDLQAYHAGKYSKYSPALINLHLNTFFQTSIA
jgi:hypothetical protein